MIQQQRPDPGFTNVMTPGLPGGAEVTVDNDGTRWFVIARDNGDGTTQNIAARPGDGPVPTDLDSFIAWARQQYDSGEGLL